MRGLDGDGDHEDATAGIRRAGDRADGRRDDASCRIGCSGDPASQDLATKGHPEAPLLESIDVCSRGASTPQINVVVTAPNGDVVINQWHWFGLTEPGVIVNADGSWSVELQLRDDAGQPTGDPFPSLGTYAVHVDCVTTYLPQVRIPYNDLSFEVVDGTTTTSTTAVTSPPTTPPTPNQARPAAPVRAAPDFTG